MVNDSSDTTYEIFQLLHPEQQRTPSGIAWVSQSCITSVLEDEFLWMRDKAFPYPVRANNQYDGQWQRLRDWITESAEGRHFQYMLDFYFELEEDAIKFKLAWG